MRSLWRVTYHKESRHGKVEGLFIAENWEVEGLFGKPFVMYDVLGKHSEVYGTFEAKMFEPLECHAPHFLDNLRDIFKGDLISGYSPFEYVREKDE